MEAGRRALEFSRKAIDAYKKTLLVDKVTTDDERSPPVYLLNEISDILRSCSPDLAQEIVEYTFRRIRHPSPQVKYKVLRFIKYTVNRAGSTVYRKELQSYSASIRELFNFQGQVDPFRGNALNQAVRDAAHEAIKAVFSSDTSLPTSSSIHSRIEGFGNGDFAKSSVNSYRTAGIEETERGSFEHNDGNGYFDSITSKGEKGRELQEYTEDMPSWHSPRRDIGHASFHTQGRKALFPEDRLVENITAPQGLRLQPTQESLQFLLASAKTLDAIKIAHALKAKLRSSSWQVRLKAVCVLQALLLQKDSSFLQAVEADEGGFQSCVQECVLSSQQTTLRKKAKETLDILLALKEAKMCEGSANILVDDASPIIKTCDMPFFTIETNSRDTGFSSPSPTTTSATNQEAVDFLSFQTDDFGKVQAAETSPNSVMDDPFDGLCIHGSNERTGLHVEDLLSGGWAYDGGHHERAPFEQTSTLLSMTPNSDVINQSQYRATGLDRVFMSDFTFKSFTTSGKISTSSLESKTFPPQSLSGFHNLNTSHMLPTGTAGHLHNSVALQQQPGNIQGFEFGPVISFGEKTVVGRHGLADTHFKEFGLSS